MHARIWSMTLAILLSAVAIGCERGEQKGTDNQEETAQEKQKQETSKQEPQKAEEEAEPQKDDGERSALMKSADELEESIDEFGARIEMMSEESGKFTKENLADIESKLEEFGARINELEEEAEDSTGQVRAELKAQIDDMRQLQGRLMDDIEKRIEDIQDKGQ